MTQKIGDPANKRNDSSERAGDRATKSMGYPLPLSLRFGSGKLLRIRISGTHDDDGNVSRYRLMFGRTNPALHRIFDFIRRDFHCYQGALEQEKTNIVDGECFVLS